MSASFAPPPPARRGRILLLAALPATLLTAALAWSSTAEGRRLQLLAAAAPAAPEGAAVPAGAPLSLPAGLPLRGVWAPWRVGLQAGHWKVEKLPDELRRLRGSTGARYGEVTELAVNLEIARRTARRLEAAGVVVDLLPATVPPGYDADAFVAIHADGAWRPDARGWKVASPWRASAASRRLRLAVHAAYARVTGLPEDRAGITSGMRGYYAFSPHRVRHAIAPTTAAAIIETGFITHAVDREFLLGQADRAARGIAEGIIAYLAGRNPFDTASLLPIYYPDRRVAERDIRLRLLPREDSPLGATLQAGALVRPVDREGDWLEVVERGNYRRFGWLREEELE